MLLRRFGEVDGVWLVRDRIAFHPHVDTSVDWGFNMLLAHLISDKVKHVRRCGKLSKRILPTVNEHALPNVR